MASAYRASMADKVTSLPVELAGQARDSVGGAFGAGKALGAAGKGGNTSAAEIIGKRIAERAKAAGVERVAFDRAGYAYHGRVKALAEAARAAGLQF